MRQIDKLHLEATRKVFSPTGVALNTVVSAGLAVFFVGVLGVEWIIWQILAVIVIAHVISIGLYSTTIAIIMAKNSNPEIDLQDEVDDPDNSSVESEEGEIYGTQVVMNIVRKSEPVGKFNNIDIFEWIDMADNDNDNVTTRFEFFGTIRPGEEMNWLPVGCIILDPGVIYIPAKI